MITLLNYVCMLTQEEVKHIALLARIGLSDTEVERYQKDLSTVLVWFERLAQVDTEQVAVIGHVTGRSNVARSDVAVQASNAVRSVIQANFPDQKEGFLKVRSVF